MTGELAARTERALGWRGLQLVGHKAIFLVRLVVLARILGPTAFGLLTIAQTAIGVLNRVTDLGMIPALVQRPELRERDYDAAWTVNLLRGAIITVLVVAAAPVVANLFDAPESVDVIRVLALSPLLLAGSSIGLVDLERAMDFRSLAFIDIGQALTNTVVSIALATRFGVWALILGSLAGAAAHLALSYRLAPHRPRLVWDARAIRPLIQFGRWILLTGVIAVAGHFALKAVISSRLGVAELGLYYMATQIAFLPAEVATQVGGSVAFPLFSRIQAQAARVGRAFRALLVGMAVVLVPPCALLMGLAPGLVDEVLGGRWAGTALPIQILALVPVVGLFGEASIPLLKGMGRPSRLAVLEGVQSALLVAFVWQLSAAFGLPGAVSAWIPATLASQVAALFYVRRVLEAPATGASMELASVLVASAAAGVVAALVSAWLDGLPGLLAGALLGGATALALLWVADRCSGGRIRSVLAEVAPSVVAVVGRVGAAVGLGGAASREETRP